MMIFGKQATLKKFGKIKKPQKIANKIRFRKMEEFTTIF